MSGSDGDWYAMLSLICNVKLYIKLYEILEKYKKMLLKNIYF